MKCVRLVVKGEGIRVAGPTTATRPDQHAGEKEEEEDGTNARHSAKS